MTVHMHMDSEISVYISISSYSVYTRVGFCGSVGGGGGGGATSAWDS